VFHLRKKEINLNSAYQVCNKICSGLNLLKFKDIVGSVLEWVFVYVKAQYKIIVHLTYT